MSKQSIVLHPRARRRVPPAKQAQLLRKFELIGLSGPKFAERADLHYVIGLAPLNPSPSYYTNHLNFARTVFKHSVQNSLVPPSIPSTESTSSSPIMK